MDDGSLPDDRPTLYSLALIVAVAIGVVVGTISIDTETESFGGDYPAFYGAGRIAADGDWDGLYDLDRQIEAQRGLYPDADTPQARFFAYPPQVAAAYQPFSALDYSASYLLHTALMALLLWGSLLLARPMVPWLRGRVAVGFALCLLFWPMFRSVTGGSNTALTLFLMIAAWRLIHDDRQLAAGLVASALLFKPQFAIPLIGLFLLARYWRVVTGAAVGAVAFFISGVMVSGWGWIAEWLEVASDFGKLDSEINGHSAISFVGFAENLFGTELSFPIIIAWTLAMAVVLFLSWIWWRFGDLELDRLLAITMPGILLLSVHAMSHDGAVIVLTAAVAGSHWSRRRWLPWVVGVWLLGAVQSQIAHIGWSPGFPMLLLVLWWGWLLMDRNRRDSVRAVF